jgi:hypothetical protein
MKNLNNTLEDTRNGTEDTIKQLNKLNDTQIKKAISDAIFKVFPKEIAEIKKILAQYDKAVKSNVLTRFEYFDFEVLEKKMLLVEDIDTQIKHLVYGVKDLTNNILYQKNEMEKLEKIG